MGIGGLGFLYFGDADIVGLFGRGRFFLVSYLVYDE